MKMTLYPKTKRIDKQSFQITEKLDGSNIGFFNLNNELIVAQRNNVFKLSELANYRDILYKDLEKFLNKRGKDILSELHPNSGFFGEWIAKGNIKYGNSLDKKLYIFAKANIMGSWENESIEIYNLFLERDLLIYPFKSKVIPEFIGQPALVATLEKVSIPILDKLYDEYVSKVNRKVEGFVIRDRNGTVNKYVRRKGKKLTPHHP